MADSGAAHDLSPRVVGDVEIDRAERRVRRDGTEVHLTPTEFDLLVRLATNPRTVLTREKLLAEVWDWVDASGTRTVDSHIKALRRKLGPDLIRTVHGVGYSVETARGATDDDRVPPERRSALMRDLRPLDRFASIKIKLGVLVGSASTVCALAVWWGLHTELAHPLHAAARRCCSRSW